MLDRLKGKKVLYLAAAVNIILMVVNVFLLVVNTGNSLPSAKENSRYPYLSKRIFAEDQNDILVNFIPLRAEMNNYIEKNPEIGVYFEYLPSGTSIGVNDKQELNFASLGKVPVAMAVFKEIELGTAQLDQVLTLQPVHIDSKSGDLWKKGAGTKLTVKEALELSLSESDNTANRALYQVLPDGAIEQVFDSLDIPKDKSGKNPVISPKNYASILKTLYLAAYLDREGSDKLLDMLASSIFKDQLPAGVPKEVKVAHKVGSFDSEQVHSDCGIIYLPNRPYVLCVMARADIETSRKHISHLSRMVYGYVAQVN